MTGVQIEIRVFWVVMPCRLLNSYTEVSRKRGESIFKDELHKENLLGFLGPQHESETSGKCLLLNKT